MFTVEENQRIASIRDVPISLFSSAGATQKQASDILDSVNKLYVMQLEALAFLVNADPSGLFHDINLKDIVQLLIMLARTPLEKPLQVPLYTWCEQAYLSYSDQDANRCIRHLFQLPLIVSSKLQALNSEFATTVGLDEQYTVISGSQLISSSRHIWVCFKHEPMSRTSALIHGNTVIAEWNGMQWFSKSELLDFKPRNYISGYDIEFRNYAYSPIRIKEAWESSEHDTVTLELVKESIEESIQILNKAWPSAESVLGTFVQLLLYSIPSLKGSHNSFSCPDHPFTQCIEIEIGNPLKNLESIVHEAMHSKLYVLLRFQALYRNPDHDLSFSHPWMNRPRPIRGVFMGMHTFSNILQLYARVASCIPDLRHSAIRYFDSYDADVSAAIDEARRGDLTPEGDLFVSEVERLRLEARQMILSIA